MHHEEEDLASVLAEGIAKVLLHARHWSTSSGKGLQVTVNMALPSCHALCVLQTCKGLQVTDNNNS